MSTGQAPLEGPANAEAPPVMQGFDADLWVDEPSPMNAARLAACRQRGLDYRVLSAELLKGFPAAPAATRRPWPQESRGDRLL